MSIARILMDGELHYLVMGSVDRTAGTVFLVHLLLNTRILRVHGQVLVGKYQLNYLISSLELTVYCMPDMMAWSGLCE